MFKNPLIRLVAVAACATLVACGGKEDDKPANMTPNATPNNAMNVQPNNSNQNNECSDVTTCAAAGSSCSGSSSVVCAADAAGCLVETSTDCTTSGQMCMGGACVDVDPCTDDPACAGQTDGSRFCTGDVLTTCADNGGGCLVPSTNDCAAGGQTCDMDTQACVSDCTDDPACAGIADGESFCAGTGYTTCTLNGGGCLVGADTACVGAEVCSSAAGSATCGASTCPEALQALSCADAGSTIMIDSATGTNVVDTNGCNDFGDTYDAMEVFLSFRAAANTEVTVDFTFDTTNIDEVDAFVLVDGGMCTDPTLTCEDYDFGFDGSGSMTFDAVAAQNYFLLFEPYLAAGQTTTYGISITCTPVVCGDGLIGQGEECDDGDTDAGDGCDAACVVETDYLCSGEPSTCVQDICGDGVLSPNESCDDGGLVDGDGCDATCGVEFGYECDATGAICTMLPSLGSFAAGDPIPETRGGPILANDVKEYLITFTTDVVLAGSAVRGTTGDLDFYLFDASGAGMSSAISGDEAFADRFIGAGTYVVTLHAYGSSDVDTFTLSLSTTAFASTDKGTFAGGAAIPDSTGALTAGASTFFTITFSDDVLLTGTLTADTGDADVELVGSNGRLFTRYNATGSETIDGFGLAAGTYYLRVSSKLAAGDIGTFTLSLATTALGATDLGTVAAGGTVADQTGSLLAGASDWYKITFSTDVSLSGTLGGNATGETGVFIYSATHVGVVEFDFGDEAFTNSVVAGTYLIRVISDTNSGDVDAYTLTLDPN